MLILALCRFDMVINQMHICLENGHVPIEFKEILQAKKSIQILLNNFLIMPKAKHNLHLEFELLTIYIWPSLIIIRPPYLPRNCDHIREVAFAEREK